jgi:DNA polymerase III epsilon subunit family exonuclease
MITIVDTETTGLDPKEHEVIDFGAISLEEQGDGTYKVINKIKFKIKPKHIEKAQPTALKINGYEENKWAKAKLFEEHAQKIKEVIENSEMLLGQNLIFDIRFLISEFKRCNLKPPKFPEYIDTKEMASGLVKEGKIKRSSMDYLCEHFNITVSGRTHTALVDCERTFLVWQKLLKFTDSKTFTYTDPYEGFADNKK